MLDAIKKDLMQMSFIHDTYLFTHAGVTKTWAENYQIDTKDIQNSINSLFNRRPQAFKFAGGPDNSPFGDDLFQTPIWVRPDSLLVDMIEGYTQVVGHTSQSGLSLNNKLVLIDTLGTSEEYLVITDGKMSVKNINKITMEEPELVWNKPSAFPFVVRDVSVWVPQIVTVMEVTDVMWGSAGELLVKGPTLFDTFEKGDKKSFAFRMVFQSYEKTLTDDEVNGYVADVVKSLEQKGWEVRR